jgi:XTP/dITP diphosphohydrolase
MTIKPILLASNNSGKLRELRALLPADVPIVTPADLGLPDPEETGATFQENATIKAIAGAEGSGLLALADDSGLEVDALGGLPGVRSARFAADHQYDGDNVALLLEKMQHVADNGRTARFVCALVLAQPGGVLASATGVCEGSIGYESRGDGGFGYDPVFVLPDGRTMAEIAPAEKNTISHRTVALRKLKPALLVAIGLHSFSGE